MTTETPPPFGLSGTVTYRCHACGDMIATDTQAVLAPLGPDGELISDTRAYHPDHAPREEPDGE